MTASDLTGQEQTHVRTALRFLAVRSGGWPNAAKTLRFSASGLRNVAGGRRTPSASLAVRLARLAKVGVDDVINGKYPPAGACPHCGHMKGEEDHA